jgi:hypothetical protein
VAEATVYENSVSGSHVCVMCGSEEAQSHWVTVWRLPKWSLLVVVVCGLPGLLLLPFLLLKRRVALPFTVDCHARWRKGQLLALVSGVAAILGPLVAIVSFANTEPAIIPKAMGTGLVLLLAPLFFLYAAPFRGPRLVAVTAGFILIDVPSAEAAAALSSARS